MATISVSEVTDIEIIVTIKGKKHCIEPKDNEEKDSFLNKMIALRLALDSHRINPVSRDDMREFVNKSIEKKTGKNKKKS